MSERSFTWKDYCLLGPPRLYQGDYTFKAFGFDKTLERYVNEIEKVIRSGNKIAWRLIGYWGVGKSTFIYNLCYQLNSSLFFGDDAEEPISHKYLHALALYVNTPRKRKELFEYTYGEGLPLPWKPGERRDEVGRERKILLYECLRKLAFLLLRKAIRSIKFEQTRVAAKFPQTIGTISSLRKYKNLRTEEFIKKIDTVLREKRRDVYIGLCHILEFYLKTYTFRRIFGREATHKVFAECFSKFLYPINSQDFINGFKELFDRPDKGLRRFDIFEQICAIADVSLILAIDEVEDWSSVVKYRLDLELLSMILNKFSSMILVFRTEIIKGFRKSQVLKRCLSILEFLEDIRLPQPNKNQIMEITKGILSTSRIAKEETLFPLTKAFTLKLTKKTRRVRRFNIRIYIRALKDILEKSLTWKRDHIELTEDLFACEEVKAAVANAFVKEIMRTKELVHFDKRKLRKFAIATEIAYKLLSGQIPPDRWALEELKVKRAKELKTNPPSDMEIIASVEDKRQREKLRHIIERIAS